MFNDTKIVVSGYVGGMPDVYDNEDGSQTVVFSVGVTSRRFDKEADTWEDEATVWYSLCGRVTREARGRSSYCFEGKKSVVGKTLRVFPNTHPQPFCQNGLNNFEASERGAFSYLRNLS